MDGLCDETPSLIPLRLFNDLAMVVTIACIGQAAENAQRVYGVPASFLIAKYITDHGYPHAPIKAEDDERFPAERTFLQEAERLATDIHLSAALELAANPIAYAQRLWELGFGDDMLLFDIAARIADCDLRDCDRRYDGAGENPSCVSIDEAASILSETPERVRSLIEAGELLATQMDVVVHSLRHYEQRRLWRTIRNRHRSRQRGSDPETETDAVTPPGKLLSFASSK